MIGARMKKMPTLAGTMTPFPYSIDRDATLADARAMMTEHGIHHLPVTRDGDLVGLVSDVDLAIADRVGAEGVSGVRIDRLCMKEPYVVDLHARLDRVVSEMVERHVGAALVVRQGKLVGILTHADVCRVLGGLLATLLPHGGDDSAA